MAIKRDICEEEIEGEVNEKKRARIKEEEDRLSNLPDDLKLHILCFLNTPDAIKTTMLSKPWISFWSRIPVLDFNFSEYNDNVYEKFFNWFFRVCNRLAKLDRFIFTQFGMDSDKVLENVFEYAFSHGVKKLIADIHDSRNHTWPVCLNSSFETLTSLTLQSTISITCPFLGPRSRSFKNLTDLYLARPVITDPDPFSGFPVLERLTLANCDISTVGKSKTLHIHALNLLELTIWSYDHQNLDCCELTTPRLRLIKHQGCEFPLFRSHNKKGLPVLDTMVIGCGFYPPYEKKLFDNIFSLFCILDHNVKSLTLFRSTIEILCFFREELVKRNSPFRNLKCLKLDFTFDGWFGSSKIVADVKAYLLRNSPDAEVSMHKCP